MRAIRVVVLNVDETYSAPLRTMLLAIPGVKIIAEVDEPALLGHAMERFPAQVLVVNLDPIPEVVLPMVGSVIKDHRDLQVFTVSESTDGQLILAAMRQGVREFITKPVDPEELVAAFGKVGDDSAQLGTHGTLVTVLGGAGGVGATTLAVNLAVELNALAEGSVAIVDLDHRFGQVATHLDVDPTYTLADLCTSTDQLDPQVVDRALVRHSSGVRVLSRPLQFSQADNITAAHAVGVLNLLMEMHEYVVVDGPNRFDFGSRAVLDIADFNLIVVQLVVPTVRSVHRMLGGISEVGFNLDRMRLVANRVGCGGGGISLEDVKTTLNMDVLAEIPDDWNTVNAAINVGEPLLSSAPKSKIRLGIKALAERLVGAGAADEETEQKRGGLFSKIFE